MDKNLQFDLSKLSEYKRVDLQRFCKTYGLKANGKNAQLINQLQDLANKNVKGQVSNGMVIDEHLEVKVITEPQQKPQGGILMSPQNRKENSSVKKVVTVSLPSSCQERTGDTNSLKKMPERKKFSITPNKNWAKIHQRSFSRMEGIDDYLKKKTQKIQENCDNFQSLAEVTAQKAKEALDLMKRTHDTPKDLKRETKPKRQVKSLLPVSQGLKRAIPFNSPKADSRYTCVTMPLLSSKKKETVKRHTTLLSNDSNGDIPSKKRKQCGQTKTDGGVRASLFSPRLCVRPETPNRTFSLPNSGSPFVKTPSSKTPKKFDLQASLKKGLTYKPHVGKLKPLGVSYKNNVKKDVKIREGVKTARKPVSRDKRRKNLEDNRKKSRQDAVNAKRGIIA